MAAVARVPLADLPTISQQVSDTTIKKKRGSKSKAKGAQCEPEVEESPVHPTSKSRSLGSKSKAKGAQSEPEVKDSPPVPESAPVVVLTEDGCQPETTQRLRALRKKLRDVEALEEKTANGLDLNVDQAAKVAGKPDLEQEIEALRQRAFSESKENAQKEVDRAVAASEKAAAAEATRARAAEAKAAQEAALSRQRRNALEVIPNIAPTSEVAKNDPRIQTLLKQVSELSEDIFNDDCLQKNGSEGVSKKSGWRLSLLARPVPEDAADAPPEDPTTLLGFIVFRFRPDFGCLSIAKIAVPEQYRGRGFGKYLMEWVTKYAQQQGSLQYLSLSSLPEAVKFYQRFGFKSVKVDVVNESCDELIEGQVYMEYRLKTRPGTSGSRRHSGSK